MVLYATESSKTVPECLTTLHKGLAELLTMREKAGRVTARAARRQGLVPAVVYGDKQASTLIALDPHLVMRELSRPGWRSRLFDIQGENGSFGRGLMCDIQLHPVGDYPLHMDFQRLAAGQYIRVEIQIIIVGEEKAPGIKRGGFLVEFGISPHLQHSPSFTLRGRERRLLEIAWALAS
ncbi:50S ribosomal protein L25 [Entomobacter blattae]|uniref:50S ribosomal protein L25 n=1 Tax=Entomobacter blattae TaxID=2762277 RepID=A0A7H1NQY6_9PROT|nr:50S ribosomal protein L25 [Entomobacter blattae]